MTTSSLESTTHETDRKTRSSRVDASRNLARTAGILYLLNGIFSGFALGFVYPKVYVAGDASATAGNLAGNAGLLRAAVLADLIQATIWVFLALTLYKLFHQVNRIAATAMVVFVAIGAGITLLNEIFGFEALRVVTGQVDLTHLGAPGSDALVLLLLDAQHYGVLIAQIFFGLWLVPLGYLAYTSRWFPKALGILLVVAGICYLVGTVAAFLLPDSGQRINTLVTIPCAVAEIWMVLYLVFVGVRAEAPADPHLTDSLVT